MQNYKWQNKISAHRQTITFVSSQNKKQKITFVDILHLRKGWN